MKKTIDFDINQIVKITFRPSSRNTIYEWRQATRTPIYRGFLWFKKLVGYEETQSGFYNVIYNSYVSENFLEQSSCNIIKHIGDSDDVIKQVRYKSYVEISMSNKSTVGRNFNSDQEAKEWISKLKNMTNKTFETI
jgi:hypothetical protein